MASGWPNSVVCFQAFSGTVVHPWYAESRQSSPSSDNFSRSSIKGSVVLGLPLAESKEGESLRRFAQPNRPVTGVNCQCLPAAIHFAVQLRVAKGAFHGHGNSQTDMPVVRAGVNIGLQVRRQDQIDAAVARPYAPAAAQLGSGRNARVNASVPGFHVQGVQPSVDLNVPVPGIGVHAPIQIPRVNVSISGVQSDVAFGAFESDAAVAGVDIRIALNGL